MADEASDQATAAAGTDAERAAITRVLRVVVLYERADGRLYEDTIYGPRREDVRAVFFSGAAATGCTKLTPQPREPGDAWVKMQPLDPDADSLSSDAAEGNVATRTDPPLCYWIDNKLVCD